MHTITRELRDHYSKTFAEHGPSAAGVDWGRQSDVDLRYRNMLAVIRPEIKNESPASLLDVGCGFGGLLDFARASGTVLNYTGLDISDEMIAWAKSEHADARFVVGDALGTEDLGSRFDYVVCNGILTQKLSASISEMDAYAQALIRRMFDLCTVGIAFNVMTSKVNFMAPNLYYRNPVELLGWCFTEISPKFRIDHAYPLYEYTVYLYR